MNKVIFIVGVLIVIEGVILMARPDWYRKVAGFFASEKTVSIAPVLKIVFGGLFLVSATACKHSWVLIVFGALAIAAGIVGLLVTKEKVITFLNWWQKRSDIAIRALSVFAMAMGGLFMWLAVV
jgi:hypothetical protein